MFRTLLLRSLSVFLLIILSIAGATDSSAQNSNQPFHRLTGFEENKGQIVTQDHRALPDLLYQFNNRGMKVLLYHDHFSYELYTFEANNDQPESGVSSQIDEEDDDLYDQGIFNLHRVDVTFIGANPHPVVSAEDVSDSYNNYYQSYLTGKNVLNVRTFQKITYHDLYPHIDLVFRTSDDPLLAGALHYDFIVHPGGDVKKIRYHYSGAESQHLAESFTMQTTTSQGNIIEVISESYEQNADGTKGNKVNTSFKLDDNTVQFVTGDFDKKKTLVIDPLLLWATYCGGSYSDESRGVAVDSSNNVLIFGRTYSSDNIATVGAYQSTLNGEVDLLIQKYTENGKHIWGTYYGGDSLDRGRGIICPRIDKSIYLCGHTNSVNGFATPGTYQSQNAGENDAYLLHLDSNGYLIWCTYFGGEKTDISRRLRVDHAGNIIMVGHTASETGIATPGAQQFKFKGATDVFLNKWTPDGALIWSTYYGGEGEDHGRSVHTDQDDNILVNGSSGSTHGIANDSSWQKKNGGGQDFLIMKFTTDGKKIWATYYGGNQEDRGRGVYADLHNNIYTTGYSASDSPKLSTPGAFQEYWSAGYDRDGQPYHDGMLMKWSPSGKLIWATFIGGPPDDRIRAITRVGDYIYTGGTTSTGQDAPGDYPIISTPDAFQTDFGGDEDMFFEKWDSNGHRVWGTYFGALKSESTLALARDLDGNLYGTGTTYSANGIATPNVAQTTLGGYDDALLVKFRDGIIQNPGPKASDIESFNLNPLVNNGNFSIVYSSPSAAPCEVKIFDAIGREVYKQSIDGSFVKLTMNESNWATGVYECALIKGNSIDTTIKFMVIK